MVVMVVVVVAAVTVKGVSRHASQLLCQLQLN